MKGSVVVTGVVVLVELDTTVGMNTCGKEEVLDDPVFTKYPVPPEIEVIEGGIKDPTRVTSEKLVVVQVMV